MSTCTVRCMKIEEIYAMSTINQLLAIATDCSLSFLCGLRGDQKYRTPTLHKVLPTVHERSNPYDRYAVSTKKFQVFLLTRQSANSERDVMLYGARVTVKVLNTHHCM